LKRADLLVFTHADDHHPTADLADRTRSITNAPTLKSIHKPAEWVSLQRKILPLNSGTDMQNPLLVSGIASPMDFEQSVRSLGVDPAAHLVFPDHMIYDSRTLNRIAQVYRDVKADSVITTEKDLVKLPHMLEALKVLALRISLEITEGGEELDRWIEEKIRLKLEGKKDTKST
jgi:tetraacyldisaccharide-1-P 4'-kinase